MKDKESQEQVLEKKLNITEAAIDLYVQRKGTFTLKQISQKTGIAVGEIFEYFPNKKAILEFYYTSLIMRYELMISEIEDFEQYTLSEKLSNFIYASFDLMSEHDAYVEASFPDIILHRYTKTEYEKEIQRILTSFVKDDPLVSSSSMMLLNEYVYAMMSKKYLRLILFWLNDNSEDHELTMELTDKITAFIEEALYSSIIDRGLDMIKFVTSNHLLARNIPFLKNICSKIEIR